MLKKTIRMVVAVMIAMVSIFSGVGTAFAAGDIIDNSQKASVTIHKYDLSAAEEAGVDTSGYVSTGEPNATAETALADYSLKGVEFSYIKVGNILTFTQTEGEQTSIEVVYQVPNKLIDILNLSDPVMIKDSMECFTSDQINSALSNALLQNTETKNKLEDYIKDGTAMPVTDENGMTSASNLDLGLYLFVETKVPENVQYTTDPFFLSLPSTDVDGEEWIYDLTVYPKNQSSYPSIDKFVNEEEGYADYATASEGDTLNYTVVSKLPKITSSATYLTKYDFVDTLCKGITYNKDLSINFYGNFNNAKDNKTDQAIASFTETTDFNVIYGTKDDGSTTATISFTAAGLQKLNTTANLSEAYMGIHYTAVVNSNETVVMGHDGNTNDVVLTYSRTNTVEEEHIEDRAYVYVFGINLTKTFSDNNGDPTKVKFVLNNVSDNYYVQATGSNGVYYVTGKTDRANAAVFSPDKDGKLLIYGLEHNKYELTETETDDGYTLLRDKITIEIKAPLPSIIPSTPNHTGIDNARDEVIYLPGNSPKSVVDGNPEVEIPDGMVVLNVTNTHTFMPPLTGDTGVWFVTIAGVLISAAAIFILKRNKKDEAENI